MLGGLFAGTEEAPGEVELFQGRSYKSLPGYGLPGGHASRVFRPHTFGKTPPTWTSSSPKASRGAFPIKGPVLAVIHQLMGGLRSSMGYLGCATIAQMHDQACFVEITSAGVRESHVHDVQITKKPQTCTVDDPVQMADLGQRSFWSPWRWGAVGASPVPALYRPDGVPVNSIFEGCRNRHLSSFSHSPPAPCPTRKSSSSISVPRSPSSSPAGAGQQVYLRTAPSMSPKTSSAGSTPGIILRRPELGL